MRDIILPQKDIEDGNSNNIGWLWQSFFSVPTKKLQKSPNQPQPTFPFPSASLLRPTVPFPPSVASFLSVLYLDNLNWLCQPYLCCLRYGLVSFNQFRRKAGKYICQFARKIQTWRTMARRRNTGPRVRHRDEILGASCSKPCGLHVNVSVCCQKEKSLAMWTRLLTAI